MEKLIFFLCQLSYCLLYQSFQCCPYFFFLVIKNACSKMLSSRQKNREQTVLKVLHTVSVSNSLRENYSHWGAMVNSFYFYLIQIKSDSEYIQNGGYCCQECYSSFSLSFQLAFYQNEWDVFQHHYYELFCFQNIWEKLSVAQRRLCNF